MSRCGNGPNSTKADFAGFTLTQFRHSYIPIGQTAAARRLEPRLIGGPIINVSCLWRVVLYSPPAMLFLGLTDPRESDHGTDGSRDRFGNESR
jgi:hypothetical protein